MNQMGAFQDGSMRTQTWCLREVTWMSTNKGGKKGKSVKLSGLTEAIRFTPSRLFISFIFTCTLISQRRFPKKMAVHQYLLYHYTCMGRKSHVFVVSSALSSHLFIYYWICTSVCDAEIPSAGLRPPIVIPQCIFIYMAAGLENGCARLASHLQEDERWLTQRTPDVYAAFKHTLLSRSLSVLEKISSPNFSWNFFIGLVFCSLTQGVANMDCLSWKWFASLVIAAVSLQLKDICCQWGEILSSKLSVMENKNDWFVIFRCF